MRIFPSVLTVLYVAGLALASAGCRPPQVLGDDDCFSTVDALWTAVTAHNSELLESTAADLLRLRDAGRLSPEGHDALAAIINKARLGQWEPAARALKAFIQGQRRPAPG
jgi:hypothetical protein